MKNGSHGWLFFIDKLVDARLAYSDIKNNDEARATSTLLGKRAIIYDIIVAVLVAAGAGLVIWGMSSVSTEAVLFAVIAIISAVAVLITAALYLILALNCAIKQLCLNKRAIGWIALLFPLAAVAAAVVVIIVLGGNL